MKSLQREARHDAFITKQLGDHAGIPLLFGVSIKNISVSLVLKFHGDGRESFTIYKVAKGKKRSKRKEWNMIFQETADAVEHIHSCGYVHNDLKSNNVVLEKQEDGQLHHVIIDFRKSVAMHKAVNPVAKTASCRGIGSSDGGVRSTLLTIRFSTILVSSTWPNLLPVSYENVEIDLLQVLKAKSLCLLKPKSSKTSK